MGGPSWPACCRSSARGGRGPRAAGDEDADAALRAAVEAQIEAESLPMFLSGRLYDDGVIDPATPEPCWHVPVRHCQRTDRGDVELRRLPDVNMIEPDVTAINRVLVANRGEIARRVFATCRRLGIGTVAVYTDPDAGAPHVTEADVAGALPGTGATWMPEPTSRSPRPERIGADAVHPRYGFLSARTPRRRSGDRRRADLDRSAARPCGMGSKIESKQLMAAAGVPVLDELHGRIGRPSRNCRSWSRRPPAGWPRDAGRHRPGTCLPRYRLRATRGRLGVRRSDGVL